MQEAKVIVWAGLTNSWEKKWKAKDKGKDKPNWVQSSREQQGDKKAFLSEQCTETEKNSRMGKAKDLLKKIRDTKRIFHAKMDTINERNGKDLTEGEEIKKRCQEYTDDLYKKGLNDPDNHNHVVTHLEPDILNVKSNGP